MTDRKSNDRFQNQFHKARNGRTGRNTAHEADARDEEEDPNSEEEESCAEESDLTTAFEREIDELVLAMEELEDTPDVQDVEDLRELSESTYEGLATIRETHAERHWSRKWQDETKRRVGQSAEARRPLL